MVFFGSYRAFQGSFLSLALHLQTRYTGSKGNGMAAAYWKEKQNRAILAVSSLLAISLFGDSLLYNVLPLYAPKLGIPLGSVGLLLSMNRWVRLLSNPLSCLVFSHYGIQKPLLFFTIVGIITTFMYAQSAGLLFFLLARILWGVTWSHLRLGAYLIVQNTAPSSLGFSMGIMNAIMRLGSSFTVLFGSLLINYLGYRLGFLIIAGLSTTAVPLVLWMRTTVDNRIGDTIQGRVTKKSSPAVASSSRELPISLCNTTHFINMLVTGFSVSSLSLILQERIHTLQLLGGELSVVAISGMVLSIHYSSNLVLSPLAGHLSDYWGRYRTLFSITLLRVLALLTFALISNPYVTVFFACLIFFTGNSMKTILEAAAAGGSRGGDPTGSMSVFASFEDLGLASGPLLGYLVGTTSTFNTVFFLGALLLSVPLLLWGPWRGIGSYCSSKRAGIFLVI